MNQDQRISPADLRESRPDSIHVGESEGISQYTNFFNRRIYACGGAKPKISCPDRERLLS